MKMYYKGRKSVFIVFFFNSFIGKFQDFWNLKKETLYLFLKEYGGGK